LTCCVTNIKNVLDIILSVTPASFPPVYIDRAISGFVFQAYFPNVLAILFSKCSLFCLYLIFPMWTGCIWLRIWISGDVWCSI
jgi:hypothetical protein